MVDVKENETRNYREYDYISLILRRDVADTVISAYGAFLWKEVSRARDKQDGSALHVTLKRKHFIKNKDRLQLLQVYFESLLNDRSLSEDKKYFKSQILTYTSVAVCAGAVAIGGVTAYYIRTAIAVIGGCLFASTGIAAMAAVIPLILRMRKKERAAYDEKFKKTGEGIEEILAEAKALTEGEDEE